MAPKGSKKTQDFGRKERGRNGSQDRHPAVAGSKTRKPYRSVIPPSDEDVSILEGRHALEEALGGGLAVCEAYASASFIADDRNERLLSQLHKAGVKVLEVSAQELDSRSSHGAHQGVMARLKPYRYAALSQLIAAANGKENALIVATDHVTDAGNFGAIARSAEVVGATGLLIPNKRNARVNTAAYKTSAGAVMHLPICMEANLVRSLKALKEEGFWVVGASEHAQDILWDAPLSGRVVLVMGSEGDGLSRLVRETCDLLVKLPQVGRVESLNVAQATTALVYEWARQCRSSEG